MNLPRRAGYEVRRVQPYQASKRYTCPGCGNAIDVGVGHVVAWPQGDPQARRHWHHHCWRLDAHRVGDG